MYEEVVGRLVPDIQGLILGLTWPFVSLGIIAIALRMWVRRTKGYRLDDWLMLVAAIFMVVYEALLTQQVRVGLGLKFTWGTVYPQDDIDNIRFWQKPSQIFLLLQPVFSRWSIAVFLIRVFGKAHAWYRYFLIFWVAFMAFGAILANILQFTVYGPMSAYWTDGIYWTFHFNPNIVYVVIVLTVVQAAVADIAFATIPILYVWKLQMPVHKKLALCILLGGSAVAFLASLARFIFAVVPINAGNGGGEVVNMRSGGVFSIASGIEQGLVVVLGCLPALRYLTNISFFDEILTSGEHLIPKPSQDDASYTASDSL